MYVVWERITFNLVILIFLLFLDLLLFVLGFIISIRNTNNKNSCHKPFLLVSNFITDLSKTFFLKQ